MGSAPCPSRYCTALICPPEQARDRTVWSLLDVCLLTSAPEEEREGGREGERDGGRVGVR